MIFILIFMWSGTIEHQALAQVKSQLSPEEVNQELDKLESLYKRTANFEGYY